MEVARFIVELDEVGQRKRTHPCRDKRRAPEIPQVWPTTHKELTPENNEANYARIVCNRPVVRAKHTLAFNVLAQGSPDHQACANGSFSESQ